MMNMLVINNILGRLDQLQAILEQAPREQVEAICVLGNLLPPEEAHPATDAPQHDHRSPTGQLAAYADVLTLLGQAGLPVYLIPGAYDPEIRVIKAALLADRSATPLHFVHRTAARLGQHDVVAGFGGRIVSHNSDPAAIVESPEWELALTFEHLHTSNITFQLGQRRVFLFATPPHGQQIDADPTGHSGLARLNALIRTYQPDLVCCAGPADGGLIEQLDGTTVVNPGSVAAGAYAIVNLEHHTAHLRKLPQPMMAEAGHFTSILVALDNSAQSWRALELAAGLAQGMQARLLLLSAFDAPEGAIGFPYDLAEIESRMTAAERLVERARSFVPQLTTESDVLAGPAADAILRAAEAHHIDLIVMGARGLGPVRSMLGSVSQRVVQQATCPVLITRDAPHTLSLTETTFEEVAILA